MPTFDIPIRSDRWQLAGAGPLTFQSAAGASLVHIGDTLPAAGTTDNAISLTADQLPYIYDGEENVYLRLAVASEGEPLEAVIFAEGGTAPAIAPYLVDMALSTDADTVLTVAAPGLLANVVAENAVTVTKVNGSAMNVASAVSLAGGGDITINANGSYTFDPDGDFDDVKEGESEATTAVVIEVTDGTNSAITTATVQFSVTGVNDGPTTPDRTKATESDTPITGNLLTDDTDVSHPQGETYQVSKINDAPFFGGIAINLASGATIAVSGNGVYRYDPRSRAAGDEVVAYTVIDSKGIESEGELTITVSDPS